MKNIAGVLIWNLAFLLVLASDVILLGWATSLKIWMVSAVVPIIFILIFYGIKFLNKVEDNEIQRP